MAATKASKGRTQPVVSVERVNWPATLLKNEIEDALVSGKMSAFPICGKLKHSISRNITTIRTVSRELQSCPELSYP